MDHKQRQTPFSGAESLRILSRKAKDGTLRDVFRDWKWILGFTRRHWSGVLLYTLLGILGSCLTLGGAVLSKHLIDSIVALDKSRLIPLAAGSVALSGLALLLRSVSGSFSARLHVTVHNDVRSQAFRQLLRSRWLAIRKFSTGDLLNRFSGDVQTVASCAVNWVPNVLIHTFTLLATLAVVLYYDPVMALIAFASTPFLFLASRHLLKRQRHYSREMRQVSSGISAFQSETFRNLDTLKSFGAEVTTSQRLDVWQEDYRTVALDHNRFSIRTGIRLTALSNAVQYLAMGYCLWRLWRGEILFGTMVLFLQQRSQLSAAFSALVSQIPAALNGSVAAERVRELMELEKEPVSAAPPCNTQGSCGLTLRNIRAGYEDGHYVLSGVNMNANPGSVLALVGPSGEGKSTIMRLLLGLLPPAEGELFLTDSTGASFPLGPGTRHLFSYVPQGNTVLEGTVAENLRLVNPDVTEEEMIAALRDACAWEFLAPTGLNTRIGEGGRGLSEGQAQRIAIARALVRKAPVLLLDEATSALDRETELTVLENLTRRGLTCITATHRTSVLAMSSRVYRVRDGGIEELSSREIDNLSAL